VIFTEEDELMGIMSAGWRVVGGKDIFGMVLVDTGMICTDELPIIGLILLIGLKEGLLPSPSL